MEPGWEQWSGRHERCSPLGSHPVPLYLSQRIGNTCVQVSLPSMMWQRTAVHSLLYPRTWYLAHRRYSINACEWSNQTVSCRTYWGFTHAKFRTTNDTWFLCSSKINEKLKTWTVKPCVGLQYGSLSKKYNSATKKSFKTTNSLFPFLKHCERECQSTAKIHKTLFFFHMVTSHHSSSFHAPLVFRSSTKTPLPDLVLKPQSFRSSFSLDSAPQQPKRTGLAISNLAWNTEMGKKMNKQNQNHSLQAVKEEYLKTTLHHKWWLAHR